MNPTFHFLHVLERCDVAVSYTVDQGGEVEILEATPLTDAEVAREAYYDFD